MKIEISKKYRYRNGADARILCVDSPYIYIGSPQPVISMDASGEVHAHFPSGIYRSVLEPSNWDLIEVREPREWTIYADKDQFSHIPFPGAKAVRVREIID